MDTSPVSAAVASTIPSDAPLALNALLIMAHVHGVAASGEDLLHRFSANGKDLNQEEWLLAARYLGLKVRAVSRSISRLHLLALPAVVWQPDGQHFVLARVDDGQFLIQDLAAGKPLLLSLADFSARFSGQLILVASRASILGSLAKFDFTWFIPAVIKYRRIFLEVLAVSIVLQLFALITPLFFQVVMDKVLVNHAMQTLNVIAAGLLAATALYAVLTNGLGLGAPIDTSGIAAAPWLGLPRLATPAFDPNAIALIAPVALILVVENLGHLKAVAAMTGRSMDAHMGRAFMGDGLATILSAASGGTGVTTYAENIGVMAATRIYSTAVFVVAACMALLLGFSPKFGALIQAIPPAVMGGVSIVVFGLITVAGARIWVENKVNFADSANLLTAAITLVLGTGDFTLGFGRFELGGIGTATFGAILLHALLRRGRRGLTAR